MTQMDDATLAAERAAQGTPCWFELTTKDKEGAQAFYSSLLGWDVADSGMEANPGYLIASAGADMVAGFMAPQAPDQPTGWAIYITVDDCAATVAAAKAAGGAVYYGPEHVAGVGRFAMIGDPQGAAIGVLQGEEGGEASRAWNQTAHGHASWLELHAPDPAAALAFYGGAFGWTPGEVMDSDGQSYHMLAHDGAVIGGIAQKKDLPQPYWLPYFGVDSVGEAMEKTRAMGGEVLAGPIEVPGPAWIAHLKDPQGCVVAVVGART